MTNRNMHVPPIRGNPKRKRANVTLNKAKMTPDGGSSEKNRDAPQRKKKQKKRLKITVQRPELLEILSHRLGISKAAVFNVALFQLAAKEGIDGQ